MALGHKILLALGVTTMLAMSVVPVVAQIDIPWPTIATATEDVVVKRGANLDGTANDRIYFRWGWGDCIRTRNSEVRGSVVSLDENGYESVNDYVFENLADGEWDAIDRYNCPPKPREVKPSTFGSRPVYQFDWNADEGLGYRGKKTKYRVSTGDCDVRYNAHRADGQPTSYYLLTPFTDISLNGEPAVFEGDVWLAAVCSEKDIHITEVRWD